MVANNFIYSKLIWQNAEVYTPTLVEEPILYCTTNGKLGTFKNTFTYLGGTTKHSHWQFLKDKYHVAWWVYQKDIIPQE